MQRTWIAALALAGLLLGAPLGVRAQDDLARSVAALESPDATQRARAADALGRVEREHRARVVPLLREHLRSDEDWRVRASSGRAIGRLAARDAVPDLVRALRDPVVDVRVVAAAALWRLPDPAAVVPLLELLRDQDPAARQWGALALGVTGDRRATQPLIALLADPEDEVRLDALRSLGRLRDPDALEALERHARDERRATAERLEALHAIGALDGPRKLDALVRLLQHSDPLVRARAAETLGRVGDALATPALRERRTEERSPTVRRAIDEALESIRDRAAGHPPEGSGTPLNLPPI